MKKNNRKSIKNLRKTIKSHWGIFGKSRSFAKIICFSMVFGRFLTDLQDGEASYAAAQDLETGHEMDQNPSDWGFSNAKWIYKMVRR